jgi:hypothetical protein
MRKFHFGGYIFTSIIMLTVGVIIASALQDKTMAPQSGTYEWQYSKIVVGQDQDIVIDGDRGFIPSIESYIPTQYFQISGDSIKFKDGESKYYYHTESGFNIIEKDNGTHSVWKLKK